MKDEDLNKLEDSKEIKRILETSKVLYDKDKAENAPRSFNSLMQQIEHREGTSRKLTISPWWLAAACLVGMLIGWNFPFENATIEDKLAVNDTVVITEKHTDTIYQQVPVGRGTVEEKMIKSEKKEITPAVHSRTIQEQKVSPSVITANVTLPTDISRQSSVRSSTAMTSEVMLSSGSFKHSLGRSSTVMTVEVPIPDPRISRPATAGRSLSQEDFPIHLLVSL